MSLLNNRLCRTFIIEDKGDYEDRLAIVGKLRFTLEQLAGGHIPHNQYTSENIRGLVDSLLNLQRSSQGALPGGSWAVAEPFDSLPADEFMDMVVFPTVLGIALLSRLLNKQMIERTYKVIEALKAAFQFLLSFPFGGEGMDRIYQQNEIILLFGLGKVPELLHEDSSLSPDFYALLMNAKASIQKRIEQDDLKGSFGEDYSQGYQLALVALRGL
ncbi:hypothetical protein [Spirochaeta cellobiosiphila]|uniref:hypothetical protein n=1 Tax=Spirochaeta cellobiosiphila TaxID=504483 RepID=UPI0012EC808A|nr:hypothetical protein [Spirochaeta cellobiosiphila]